MELVELDDWLLDELLRLDELEDDPDMLVRYINTLNDLHRGLVENPKPVEALETRGKKDGR